MMVNRYIITISLLFSFSSIDAQMIKTFPTSPVVDTNTYFLSQEFQGGTSWSLAMKTPANQIKTFIGSVSGGVTSISQGYGLILSPNPIVSTGSAKIDSNTIYNYFRSFINLQSVTDGGNTSSDSIVVKNLEVKGNSFQNGFIALDSQSSSPPLSIHKLKLFMGSSGNLGFIGSKGFACYLNISRFSASRSYGFPDRNLTIDSLTTLTQTVGFNKYLINSSGNLSSISLIPISDINATGTPSSTTYLRGDGSWSAISSGTVTSFSSNNLNPLFSTSVATPTSTPVLSFSLSNAASYSFFANFTGSSTTPTYFQPTGTPSSTTYFRGDGSWSTPSGTTYSLTTIGSSGASTLIGTTFNIPNYTLAGLGGISLSSLSGTSPITYNSSTGAIGFSSSYLGQTSIATLGTISTGTWNGTAITGTYIASSVALAGSPTTTTQAVGDNSTKIATDAFVYRLAPADTTISAAYTLTSNDNNRWIHCTNSSNIAVTVPTGLPQPFRCNLFQEGSGTVTPTSSSTTFYYWPTSTTKSAGQGSGFTIVQWASANSFTIQGALQ